MKKLVAVLAALLVSLLLVVGALAEPMRTTELTELGLTIETPADWGDCMHDAGDVMWSFHSSDYAISLFIYQYDDSVDFDTMYSYALSQEADGSVYEQDVREATLGDRTFVLYHNENNQLDALFDLGDGTAIHINLMAFGEASDHEALFEDILNSLRWLDEPDAEPVTEPVTEPVNEPVVEPEPDAGEGTAMGELGLTIALPEGWTSQYDSEKRVWAARSGDGDLTLYAYLYDHTMTYADLSAHIREQAEAGDSGFQDLREDAANDREYLFYRDAKGQLYAVASMSDGTAALMRLKDADGMGLSASEAVLTELALSLREAGAQGGDIGGSDAGDAGDESDATHHSLDEGTGGAQEPAPSQQDNIFGKPNKQ